MWQDHVLSVGNLVFIAALWGVLAVQRCVGVVR